MTSLRESRVGSTRPGGAGWSHRFLEHGGEVEVELVAGSEAGIFAAALEALAELVGSNSAGAPARRTIELTGRDRELLLVDWLGELLYLAEVEQFVPAEIVDLEVAGETLRATVGGHRGRARPLVKGVALHELRFAREGGGWHGHVVLDV